MASSKNKPPYLSKLLIDDQYKIWLPDYDNLEILLTPLPKTLYLFILKHPEGIRLKELAQHRKEILTIYSKIGNRLNLDQMKKSIRDLTDMRSNSVHEKCSRIRQAFSELLHPTIANQYYIVGSRNQPKSISLCRNLIIMPDGL
jgi:hypothetical protein